MIQSGAGGLAALVVTTCPAVAARFDLEPAPSPDERPRLGGMGVAGPERAILAAKQWCAKIF